MSGSKRGSAYRKSVVSAYENDYPEPGPGEVICKIVGSRGANVFETVSDSSDEIELVILPRKFQNLIWVKRNDFVIIERGVDEDAKDSSSQTVMYLIKHILGKDQINNLKKKGMWPAKFDESGRSRGGYADDMDMVYASENNEEEYEEEEVGQDGAGES